MTSATTKLTAAERKAQAASLKAAQRVLKLRKAGKSWAEVKEATGLKTATQGRSLLRRHGLDEGMIAPSYERTAAFRAAESERRQAAKEPVKPARKPRARKAAK